MDVSLLYPYSQPCLASTNDNSTVYLVGISIIGGINVHTISLTKNTTSTNTFSSSDNVTWDHDAPIACTSYLGRSLSDPFTVHIQQLGPSTTKGTNFYSNGTFVQPSSFDRASFLSKRTYAYIGQAGDNAWAFTRNNDTLSPWSAIQLDARNGSFSHNDNMSLPFVDPLLFVGTYSVSSSLPANGYIVIFDKMNTGMIYRTICNDFFANASEKIQFLDAKPVDMNGVILTADAFYTNMKSNAYILDKAQDGSISIYYIDPSISTTLQRIPIVPTRRNPRFTSGMAAAVENSQIILYSRFEGGSAGHLNLLNTETNKWDGPYKVLPTQTPGDQNHTGSNLGAIIGGVVGGIAVLAVAVLLFVRRRRRRENNKENINKGDKNGTSNIDEGKNGPPTEETTRSPQGQLMTRRHPQFPAGVGLTDGYTYEEEPSVAPTAPGPQFIPPDHQQYSVVVNPFHLHTHNGTVQPKVIPFSQDWTHFPRSFGNKSEHSIDSEVTAVASLSLHTPPLSPPTIPARPSGYASYSLVQLQDYIPS